MMSAALMEFLDALEDAASHSWCNRPDSPATSGVTFTDHDRDPVGGLDCSTILDAVAEIRAAMG